MHKAILLLLMLGGGPAAAEAARGVADPRAFIAEQYAAMARDPDELRPPVDYAYSDQLRALFEAYDAWTAVNGLGALDFDWWTNSQDWVLSDLRVTEASAGPDRRIVSANFNNGDRPDQIRFLFVRQGGRWFLDDAVEGTGGGGEGWTLSDLLRERPE